MKLSMMLMVWNTAHLLSRTLHTLKNQGVDEWELLVIDDMSEDDVAATVLEHGQGLPIKYHRLEHNMGMRGNTVSINYGISKAKGEYMMWSTPEVMLSPNTLKAVIDTHEANEDDSPLFITVPSHGLTPEIQLEIDSVDWMADLHSIKELVKPYSYDDWASRWFYINFYEDGDPRKAKKKVYGNNQSVAVHRLTWLDRINSFPFYCDYGTDDPWIGNVRRDNGYVDVTLWEYEAYHQWHPPIMFWMAMDKAPYWNKYGHTIKNLKNDPRVSKGGTCELWDDGDTTKFSRKEKLEHIELSLNNAIATGAPVPVEFLAAKQ